MDANFTLIFFLSSSVTFLSLTFSVVYFWNNFRLGLEQRLLGLVLFCVSYIYFVQHLNINFSIYFFPHLFRTGSLAGVIAISLMYLLVQKRISNVKFSKIDLWHGVPLLLYIINYAPFFIQSASEKKEILNQIKINGDFYVFNEGWLFNEVLFYAVFAVYLLVYLVLSVKVFIKYYKQYHKKSPCILMLKWYFFILLTVFTALFLHYFNVFSAKNSFFSNVGYYSISLIVLMYFLFEYKLIFGNLFAENELTDYSTAESFLDNNLIYSDSSQNVISGKRVDVLLKIENFLNESKAYLKVDFSLQVIENEIGENAKKISTCIKEQYNLNFNQYINILRIKYCVEMLQSNKKWRNFSIESIAENVGFNNPGNFYANFKSITKKSPREFIDALNMHEFKK